MIKGFCLLIAYLSITVILGIGIYDIIFQGFTDF